MAILNRVALAALLCCTALGAQQTPTLTVTASSPWLVTPSTLRAGGRLVLSARMLPADASGTLTFSIDGAAVQTVPVAQQTASDVVAIGDAATFAGYIADPAQRWQSILGSTLHLTPATFAAPGATACSALYTSLMPSGVGASATANPLYTILLGTNEVQTYGSGANEAVFSQCQLAMLSWLGLPRSAKVLAGDSAVAVRSGGWTSAPAFGNASLDVLTSTSGSGTVRCTLTTHGGAAYLWYLTQASSAGSFTVGVDGGTPGAAVSTLFPSGTPETIPGSYGVLRLPIAAGIHTFDIGVQSGTVSLLGMGTAPESGTLPTVLAGDVLASQNAGLTATLQAYTADIQGNVALLAGDGLDLRFAPTANFMAGTVAEMIDQTRPNALGLAEIAEAFLAAAGTTTSGAVTVAGGSYSIGSLPVGAHSVSVAYSGDTKYASATTPPATYTIYDPTSTVTLTAPPLIADQTPVTLTASIAQTNADGAVAFVDTAGGGSVTAGSAWLDGDASPQLTVPSLAIGQHTLVAQFSGGAVYAASASAPVTVNVSGTYTTTSLTSAATRFFAGSAVTLTATVSRTAATGEVTFYDGAAVLGTGTLAQGVAALATSGLATGTHNLTAAYSGDSTDDPSQSPVLSIQVEANPTTLTLAATPSGGAYGSPIALTAMLAGAANATGSVSFSDSLAGATRTLGQSGLAGESATLTSGSLAPGSHTIIARYSGDGDNLPASSAPAGVQIALAPSSIALAPIPASVAFGSAISFAATLTPADATGTVTFSDSVSGALAEVAIANGTASYATSTLAPGAHMLTASYSGDSFRAASGSAARTTSVAPRATAISLTGPPATVYAGAALTLTASVLPASATGSVLFRDAGLGVLGESSLAGGAATLTLAHPAIGSYAVTASYTGDFGDAPSTSAAVTTQVELNPVAGTLTSSAASVVAGTPLMLTLRLSSPAASGSATFLDGTAPLGTALVSQGMASLTTSALAVGSHALSATYSGDSLDASATTSALLESITAAPSSTTLALSQASVIAGSPFAANIRVHSSFASPSGTVTVRSGSTVLASGALANAAAGSAYATLTLSSGGLGLGTFPLTASYSGDGNDQPSDSSATPISVTVAAIPTTSVLTLSANPILAQASVTLSAAVTSALGIPTGSMAFLSGGKTVATATLSSSGTASTTLSAVPPGTQSLSVSFTPTGLFAASTSAAQTLTIVPPLSAALSPSSVAAKPGGSVTATLTLTPLMGYSGPLQTQCQTSASFLTCSLKAPSSLSGPVTTPVEITVAQTSAASSGPGISRGVAPLLALLAPLLLRRRTRRLLVLIAGAAVLSLGGCADGGNFFSTPSGAQSVTVTVTAAGTAIPARLTVNISN